MMFQVFVVALLILNTINITAKAPENPEKDWPLKIGNFSVAASQQPSPLFSFGQIILERGDVLGYTYLNGVHANLNSNEMFTFGAIGLTDKWTIAMFFPYAIELEDHGRKSSGLEDISLFTEYAFYDHSTESTNNFATVVGGIFFPSGSAKINPPTGTGSVSLFTGFTFVHIDFDWYYFFSPGVLVTTKNKANNKVGDQFLYQWGLGHNIKSPKGWLYLALVEFFGFYVGQSIEDNKKVCGSEGNIFYIGPSFYMSNARFQFQFGMAFPISQRTPVGQRHSRYILSVGGGWKFDGPALHGKNGSHTDKGE